MTPRRPAICVVTRVRGSAGSAERERLYDRLTAAAEAGATMIQVRDRLPRDRDLLEFTTTVRRRLDDTETQVLVNDRLDVALAAGAHGVHLKSDGPTAADVRMLAPEGFVVGRSIHGTADAAACEAAGGYDYLLFGTVFPSESKPDGHPVAGLEALAEVCAATPLPVLAIGGIDPTKAADVARAGAWGVAAISLFATAGDITAVVTHLRRALTAAEGTI